ncbi:MAG: hypothetical protein GXP38_15495 [Chloroflexi bacterium]|nr:hypothetical protein [Chloroflexota bacterium]
MTKLEDLKQGATITGILPGNKPDDWILALVEVPKREETPTDVAEALLAENGPGYFTGEGCRVRYLRHPFRREPDFDAVGVNYDWSKLWNVGTLMG